MAGGGGTRFWPRSRAARPKQFLALAGQETLFQMAVDRVADMVQKGHTWIGTAAKYRDQCQTQAAHILPEHVVGEPSGRDTAPCIGLAAALIAQDDPDAVMLVMPADHVIEPASEFHRAVKSAVAAITANPDALVTFGITPTYAATGYGYIHRGDEVGRFADDKVYRVDQFREKPKAEVAEQFVDEGGYYWNSGIFVWRVRRDLSELRRNKPALADGIAKIADAWDTPKRPEVLAADYPTLEKISIDYAVMEQAKSAMVLEAPFDWDDVGSWLALERLIKPDAAGNTVLATHAGINTENCVVVGDADRLIATVGVQRPRHRAGRRRVPHCRSIR